jgi:hypothetical protein
VIGAEHVPYASGDHRRLINEFDEVLFERAIISKPINAFHVFATTAERVP